MQGAADPPQLVEGRHVEPGALVAGRVEVDAHGVLLQERRLALVDGQILVRLQVKQLKPKTALLLPQKVYWQCMDGWLNRKLCGWACCQRSKLSGPPRMEGREECILTFYNRESPRKAHLYDISVLN